MYKAGNCSPKALEDNNNMSCLNKRLLIKIAKILNENPNCDNIDCNIDDYYKPEQKNAVNGCLNNKISVFHYM